MARVLAVQLSIVEGPDEGLAITTDGQRIVIGRSSECDLVLSDRSVSRQHAAIERDGDDFVVEDLGSHNGTLLGGQRVDRAALREGSEISIGRARLLVRCTLEKAAAPEAEATLVRPRADAPPPAADETVRRPRPSEPARPAEPDETVRAARPEEPRDEPRRESSDEPPPSARAVVRAEEPADVPIVLTVVSGPDRGQVYAPYGARATIGRLATCDVPLNDSAVSRLHATLTREDDGWAVRDENSSNGTLVGTPPKPVALRRLEDGDRLVLGETEIEISFGGGAAAVDTGDATVMVGQVGDRTFAFRLRSAGGSTSIRRRAPEVDRSAETRVFRRAGKKTLRLEAVEGPSKGIVIDSPEGMARFTIGRTSRSDVTLPDPTVSGVHFSISREGDVFHVADAGSRNGTFVGDDPEPVSSKRIEDGDRIRAGESTFVVRIREEGAAEPAPKRPAAAPREIVPIEQAESREEVLPEHVRSAEAKERISRIMKGVSLRPGRTPGTSRQWATWGVILAASVLSLGFTVRWPSGLAAGPLSEPHADLDGGESCGTCHVAGGWTGTPAHLMSRACADCHTDTVEVAPAVTTADDCASCHVEHRGRAHPLSGGAEQCWSCHVGGGGEVRDFALRPMRTSWDSDAALEASGLQVVRTGVLFSHSGHQPMTEGDERFDTCVGCHAPVGDGRTFALPGHAECLECHDAAVSADMDEARAAAGPDCLECHVREDGSGDAPVASAFAYVSFRHDDHADEFCQSCHASVWQGDEMDEALRSPDLYPVPMDACVTCHEQEGAVTDCLSCHLEHHAVPETIGGAAGRGGGLFGLSMALVVLSLGGLGYVALDMRWVARWRADQESAPKAGGGGGAAPAEGEVMPFPTVDAEACISCGSCYGSCPENVLAGDDHGKSIVVNPDACVALEGCSICEQGCPTGAIRVTTAALVRTVERPDVDEDNQAKALPGLFFVGEVIGAALIKSAINQGTDASRYVESRRPRMEATDADVVVVGAGPGGLGAALEAKRLGLRYLVFERDTVASTIRSYPRDKAVLAEPVKVPLYGMLPMMDAQKETLISVWRAVVETAQLEVSEGERVETIERDGDVYVVRTSKRQVRTVSVILAIGTRGNPRKLGCPGESPETVSPNLIDASEWTGKSVLVVGGGDSAVEAVVALGEAGATAYLSYRKDDLSRVKPRNREALDAAAASGKVQLRLRTQVARIEPGAATLTGDGGEETLAVDHVFAMIGAEPPKAWIESIGVPFVERQEEAVKWS